MDYKDAANLTTQTGDISIINIQVFSAKKVS